MKQRLVAVLVVLLLFGLVTALLAVNVPARSVDQEVAKLKATPLNNDQARHFKFIVLSDVHTPLKPPAEEPLPMQMANFQEIIAEANLLHPAFMVGTGDLVDGYATPEVLNQQWDNYLEMVATSQQPFISVPGNHDLYDEDSIKVWRQRIGEPYYSFDYGKSHFICLNSEEPQNRPDIVTRPGTLGPAQLAWLEADLKAHKKAENIFVFLHNPYFTGFHKQSDWPAAHNLLKQYNTRAVFAGHYHEYRKCDTVDGISYVINSTSCSESGDTPELGDFRDYLLVEVEGKQVNWLVVRPGAILPPDVMTQTIYDQVQAGRKGITFSSQVEPYASAKLPAAITVSVENPTTAEINAELAWKLPSTAWKVTPASVPLKIAPGGKATARFAMQLSDSRWTAGTLPSVTMAMPLSKTKRPITIQQWMQLASLPMECPRAVAPPKIDGNLTEWKSIRAMMIRPEETGGWSPADFFGSYRVMWDDKNLYFAAVIQDDISMTASPTTDGAPGDLVGFGIQGKDFRLGMIDGKGVIYHETPQGYAPLKGATIAAVRKGNSTFYEVALPLAQVFAQNPKVGEQTDLGIYASDQDAKTGADWMAGASGQVIFK